MGVLNTFRSGLNVLFTPVLYGVVASLALQLSTWDKGDRTQDKLQDTNNPDLLKASSDTFDFVIVGGGTAGTLVANRLSEHYSVLLLEYGGEPNPLVYVPGLARNLMSRQEVDWSHKTVAQRRACLLSQFKRASWSAGKGLGGSGNLGWMVSLRGNPKDYDNWGKLVGDEGWEYVNLRKYFQRHENFVGNTTDPEAHAQQGELTIQLPDYRPLAQEFVGAGKELGYPNLDLNGRYTEGFDEVFSPCKKGEKLTAYKVFVEPIKRREKLTIRKFAGVSKVLLRKADNSAYGVEYERHGKKSTVYATKEVILSAGTINSPKLLLLSGIGPKKHLEDVGIKPLINLPVGRNLQDHIAVHLGPFFIKDPLSFDFDRDVTAKSFFEYGTFGTGPVTTTGYTAHALLSSSFARLRGEKDWPDLQLLMHGASVHANYAADMAHAYGLYEEPLKKYYKHATGRHSFHIVVSLARPYARGEVRLASRNPTNPMIIDPKYLEDPWDFDVKTLVEGVKKAVQIVEGTGKFSGIEGKFTNEVLPGCEKQKFRSDEYWECYVRQYTVSMHNPVGTCTMGPVGSPHTVVDSKMRVVDAPRLRVIDASVMPSIVVGGTQQTTLAIAERGAENVIEFWRKREREGSVTQKFVKPETELVGSSSSEVFSVRTTVPPPLQPIRTTAPPPPPLPPQEVTTQPSFLQSFTISPQTSQTWQNTLDQIAAFSKQIQHSLNQVPGVTQPPPVPKVAPPKPQEVKVYKPKSSTSKPTAASTKVTTTTTTKATVRPQIVFFQTATPTMAPITPSVGVTYHSPTSKATTPMMYVPIIPFPTQQVKISNYSPAPKVTTYRPSSSSPSSSPPRPTTFRPLDHEHFNSTMFSVNVPIIKAKYHQPILKPIVHSQPSSVKVYSASSGSSGEVPPRKLLQNIIRKEHQYQKFIPPKPSTARVPTITTTTPRPSSRRPLFEMVNSQVLPHGYNNYVEIPLSNMEYYPSSSAAPIPTQPPTRRTTTTTRRPSTRRQTPPPIQMIPAIQLTASALETTTTRYTVPGGLQNFAHTHIQSIPQNVILTGLEPFSLVDVTTASDVPRDHTTTKSVSSTVSSPLTQTAPSGEAPIYYVVRKKNKQIPSSDQYPDYPDVQLVNEAVPSRQQMHHLQQQHHHQQQQQSRLRHSEPPRRQRPPPPHRKPARPHHHPQQRRPTSLATSQSQYPLITQSTTHYFPQEHLQHFITSMEDQQGLGSQRFHSILPSPHKNSRSSSSSSNNGVITAAISSPVFEQGVLDQLLTIQK